ncbi:MAG: winged helix-turn-helix transcriptional regulator [Gammaproteobacteria bacterium]
MERSSFKDFSCSIARTLDVVGEWWTVLILRDLFLGFDRFDDIQRNLGIATNVLTARLRTLAEQQIIERTADPVDKRKVRYRLTEQGRDLYPVLLALTRWGDKWRAQDGPPLHIRHRGCGHVTTMLPVCAHCHEPLTAANIAFEAGPGGREGPGTACMGQLFGQRPPTPT